MGVTFKVDGLQECGQRLRKLPEAISKKIQEDTLRAAGEPMAEMAKAMAPHDHGDLQRSITVSPRLTSRQYAQFEKEEPSDVVMFVGPDGDGFYGQFIEFGTVKLPAHPFMRPAWDSAKGEILEKIAEDLAKRITGAARG